MKLQIAPPRPLFLCSFVSSIFFHTLFSPCCVNRCLEVGCGWVAMETTLLQHCYLHAVLTRAWRWAVVGLPWRPCCQGDSCYLFGTYPPMHHVSLLSVFCYIITRIHKDKSFHCEVCNVCLDKRLEGNHKCRPDSGHDECCICLEVSFLINCSSQL